MQTFLDEKLVITPSRKRVTEINDILTWVEAFTIYSLILCSSIPSRWADLARYKLLIIQTAKKFQGRAWQHYDIAFRKEAAASGLKDWSRMHTDLYNFHTRAPYSTSPRSSTATSSIEADHNPQSSQICFSWNAGQCRWPFGRCRFRHACELCNGEHRRQTCPYQSSQAAGRSRSPTPPRSKHRRR